MGETSRIPSLSVALLLVTSTLALLVWVLIVYPATSFEGSGDERVPFALGETESVAEVASELAEAGVIEHPWAFQIYLRSMGAEGRIREGTVLLHRGKSPSEVARQIARGLGPSNVRVTLVEGLTRFQIAERLDAADVCDAAGFLEETEGLEGSLFPDTYELRRESEPSAVAERMSANFRARVAELFDRYEASQRDLEERLGWGQSEILTLASIVEKEAQAPSERARIAGVFINRLTFDDFRPKRLQADPTVSYGCVANPEQSEPCRDFDGRITRAMLGDRDNPYNTYRHEGLPPGPIANPGLASIEAVLNAEEHRYLYFVASGGGRHHFSETLDEHNRAVNRYVRGITETETEDGDE